MTLISKKGRWSGLLREGIRPVPDEPQGHYIPEMHGRNNMKTTQLSACRLAKIIFSSLQEDDEEDMVRDLYEKKRKQPGRD